MDISIILLNYKTKGLVKQSLKQLAAMQVPFNYEIFVVDNNSGDGSIEMVHELFPSVITIQNAENLGFGAGNNIAMQKAKGEYILILNPDVAIVPEELTKLLGFMQGRADVGIVAPKLLNPDKSVQYSCFRFPSDIMPIISRTPLKKMNHFKDRYNTYRMHDFDHARTIPVQWVVGGCMLIRRHALEKTGFFDERYFMYYEDIDLCRTMWKHGYKVYYFHEAALVHYHQRLSAEYSLLKSITNPTLYYHISSWIRYVLKYWREAAPRIEN